MRVMGLVECDARLLDGGVEFPVNGVAADGSKGDVFPPLEVKVCVRLLRLLTDEAEQSSAPRPCRGPIPPAICA